MREDESERGRKGERGRSLNGDRPTTIPTELLAVVRRFRESNLSCDHLRECLNELLGVGLGTTSLRGLLSARHLVWECGPNRNKRRTETTDAAAATAAAAAATGRKRRRRRREEGPLFLGRRRETAGVDLPPSWFIAQSAFTANGFVFAGPMHAYLYDTNRPAPASFLGLVSSLLSSHRFSLRRSYSFLALCSFVRVARRFHRYGTVVPTILLLSRSGRDGRVADNVDLSTIVSREGGMVIKEKG